MEGHTQTEKGLLEMIENLSLVSQPLPLCEMLHLTTVKGLALV